MKKEDESTLVLVAVLCFALIGTVVSIGFLMFSNAEQKSEINHLNVLLSNSMDTINNCTEYTDALGIITEVQAEQIAALNRQASDYSRELAVCINNFSKLKRNELELTEWYALTREFAATHTYVRSVYTCMNYSTDLANLLNARGYSAVRVIGYDKNNSLHMWVRLTLDIEPQNAKILVGDSKYKFLTEANDE